MIEAPQNSPPGSAAASDSPDVAAAGNDAQVVRPFSHSGSSWSRAASRLLRQPRFIVASAFLLVSAVGLNGATQFLRLHFRKVAVPLPVSSLSDEREGIPAMLGSHWVQASLDEPLDPEIEDQLGTKQYINRVYIDSLFDPRAAGAFRGSTKNDRNNLLRSYVRRTLERKGDTAVPALTLGVTYYTGLVDTVAHIPDRCYVASGYEPSSYDVESVPADTFADHNPRKLKFRFISFEDQTGQGRMGVMVGYFFVVNGTYTEDPIEVRRILQDLTEKYGYYAKIEVMATSESPERAQKPEYRAAVEAAMKDFIAGAFPQIEACLPDWQKVKGR